MCALRATRPLGAGAAPQQAIMAEVVSPAPQAVQSPRPQPQAAPQVAPQAAPQQQYQNSVAPVQQAMPPANPSKMSDLNAGVLEGIDGLGESSFIKVDGESFVIPDGSEKGLRLRNFPAMISYGKKFYQYVDETDPNNKKFYDSDTKLDDRYKLKFLLKFMLEMEGEDGPKEFQLSLSTTSTINFIEYIKRLAKAGYGVGVVVTQFTISRQEQQGGQKNKYSRVEFEGFTADEAGTKICGTV